MDEFVHVRGEELVHAGQFLHFQADFVEFGEEVVVPVGEFTWFKLEGSWLENFNAGGGVVDANPVEVFQ